MSAFAFVCSTAQLRALPSLRAQLESLGEENKVLRASLADAQTEAHRTVSALERHVEELNVRVSPRGRRPLSTFPSHSLSLVDVCLAR